MVKYRGFLVAGPLVQQSVRLLGWVSGTAYGWRCQSDIHSPIVLVVAPCGLCEAVWSAPVVGRAKKQAMQRPTSCEVCGRVSCLVQGMW